MVSSLLMVTSRHGGNKNTRRGGMSGTVTVAGVVYGWPTTGNWNWTHGLQQNIIGFFSGAFGGFCMQLSGVSVYELVRYAHCFRIRVRTVSTLT